MLQRYKEKQYIVFQPYKYLIYASAIGCIKPQLRHRNATL